MDPISPNSPLPLIDLDEVLTSAKGPRAGSALGRMTLGNVNRPLKTNELAARVQTYFTAAVLKEPSDAKISTELVHYHKHCDPTFFYWVNKLRSEADEVITWPFRKPTPSNGCGNCNELQLGGEPRPFIEPIIGLTSSALWKYPFETGGIGPNDLKYRYRVNSTRAIDIYYEDPFLFFSGSAKLIPIGKCETAIEARERMTDWFRNQYERPEFLTTLNQLLADSESMSGPTQPTPAETLRNLRETIRFGIDSSWSVSFSFTHWVGLGLGTMPDATEGSFFSEPGRVLKDGKWVTLMPTYTRPIFNDGAIAARINYGDPTGPGIGVGLDLNYWRWSSSFIHPVTREAPQRIHPYMDLFQRFQ